MSNAEIAEADTRECQECGAVMRRGTKPTRLSYVGLESPEFEMPGYYCECGEGVATGTDMSVSGQALAEPKQRVAATSDSPT